jgi:3-methyladenine DNA glycosylase AlkD
MPAPIAMTLAAVQNKLRAAASGEARAASARLVPTARHVYGVRVPVLNALVKECHPGGFELVEALWRSGAFEEQLLAAKLLGAIARVDPDRSLVFVAGADNAISDWAVCDTLGMQGVRAIAKARRDEIFSIAQQLLRADRHWARRLGIVLLLHFAKVENERPAIRRMLAPLRADREHYIRKALVWIDKDLAT